MNHRPTLLYSAMSLSQMCMGQVTYEWAMAHMIEKISFSTLWYECTICHRMMRRGQMLTWDMIVSHAWHESSICLQWSQRKCRISTRPRADCLRRRHILRPPPAAQTSAAIESSKWICVCVTNSYIWTRHIMTPLPAARTSAGKECSNGICVCITNYYIVYEPEPYGTHTFGT